MEYERGLLSASHDVAPEVVSQKVESLRPAGIKHVFLFVGEPRSGKTTLAKLACVSRFATCVDTDGFSLASVVEQTRDSLAAFLTDENSIVCVITFGLHRKKFDEILNDLTAHFATDDDFQLTVCRFERMTEPHDI